MTVTWVPGFWWIHLALVRGGAGRSEPGGHFDETIRWRQWPLVAGWAFNVMWVRRWS